MLHLSAGNCSSPKPLRSATDVCQAQNKQNWFRTMCPRSHRTLLHVFRTQKTNDVLDIQKTEIVITSGSDIGQRFS